jgi:3-methyladenine DNA glycosylase AlkD
MNVFISSI